MIKKKNKTRNIKTFLLAGGITAILLFAILAYSAYFIAFKPNVKLDAEYMYLYVPTGSSFDDVKQLLIEENILKNPTTFLWFAQQKNYHNRVRPGKYKIERAMGNNRLINMLRAGLQEPVRVTFNNIRTKNQLAGAITRNLEADSAQVIEMLNNPEITAMFGFTPYTISLMFLPNTYEFYWNTSPEQLFERMHREYKRFWNEERLAQAENIGLTPYEVGILASIVRLETRNRDEMPRMGGVYINRLRRGIPLQADPTVVFAIGDFTIRRVLYRHLAFESPFNTYLNKGLPPGPISLPEPYVIDAILNSEEHDYLFFAAHYDFTGYHIFARTYSEHRENARRYHRALNARNIMQ